MTFDPTTGAVLAILFLGIAVQSTFGFGSALIAMPLLAMLVGLPTATPLVALVAMISCVVIVIESWRHIHLAGAWRLVVGAVAGIPIGLYGLKALPEEIMQLILGAVLVAFAAWSLARPHLLTLRSDRPACMFGFIAGILGGAYNCNGPPVVVYGSLRRWRPARFRATLQGFFLTSGFLIIPAHGLAGLWTGEVIRIWLWSIPSTLSAIFLGRFLNHRIPAGRFTRWIHAFIGVIGTGLLIRAAVALGR